MKTKIKLFDRGTFVEAINRFKIPGIITGAILLSAGLIMVLSCVVELMDYTWMAIPTEYFYISYLVPFVMVPMMMMSAFSYLRVRKTSDFYHALPVKRETLYSSTIMAALVWIVAELVLAAIIPLITALVSPAIEMDMLLFWEVMCKALIISILVLSGFAMGVSLTGNGFTNFFVSIMILLVPRTISTLISTMAEEFTPYLVLNVTSSLLNNQYNVIFRDLDIYGNTIPLIVTVIYSLILAGIYLVVGAIAFKKRKSEMAGKPSAFRGVQVAARMILPFICLLGALFFFMYWTRFYTDEISFLIFAFSMVSSSFTIYFIYELITVRKIKKVLKSLVWYPVLVGGAIVIGIIISIGSQVAMNKKIDEDKVKYLMVENISGWYSANGFDRLENERANEIIANAYRRQVDNLNDYSDYIYFDEYEDSNIVVGINQGGATFYRIIDLNYAEYVELYQICRDEIYSNNITVSLPRYNSADVYFEYCYFSMNTERKIYETLAKEMKDISWNEIIDYSDDEFVTRIYIEQYGNQYGNQEIVVPISSATPKTLEAFIDALINDEFLAYTNDPYNDCLKHYEKGDEVYLNLYDTYIIYDDTIVDCVNYIAYYDSAEFAEETARIFKLLEESEGGDNIIIVNGLVELSENRDGYFEYVSSADIGKKYYVSDQLLEKFLEYVDKINEYEYKEEW